MTSPRFFDQPLGGGFVAIVADGMGGHSAGDVASEYAVKRLAERLPGAATEGETAFAMRQVNAGLYSEMCREPRWAAMGSAVAGLVARPHGITLVNVGDVRIYRAKGRGLVQLSVDDSLDADWEPGSLIPRSGMLTQSLGGVYVFADIVPHVCSEPCRPGATYLLCSDGLYEALSAEEMSALIGPDLVRSAQALFDAAMAAESTDNVSIILVRIRAASRTGARRRRSAGRRAARPPHPGPLPQRGEGIHRRRRK
jgi:protein phosphatase